MENKKNNEIEKAFEHDPQRGSLMLLAQLEGERLENKVKYKEHKEKFHADGWYMTLESPKGLIGIWSCWLGNQLYMGYPNEWNVDDELVREVLQVKNAKPVYYEEYKNFGYISSERKWAKFYSEPHEAGSRVWIDHCEWSQSAHRFPFIKNGDLENYYYGHDEGKMIYTFPYHMKTEKEPEAPVAKEEFILPYRDKFLELAIKLANLYGGVKSVTVKFQTTILIPEILDMLEYEGIKPFKGNPNEVTIWGDDFIYAKKENEEIVLSPANSLVPWVTNRKVEIVNQEVDLNKIHEILTL